MSCSEQIFKLLNIKPNEEFKIIEEDIICKIDENLDVWAIKDGCYPWTKCTGSRLQSLLNGSSKITKIPKIPTKEDKIVIAYAKLCGCKYIAKDENNKIYGYHTKPSKGNCCWDVEGNCLQLFYTNASFLSWEDEEPYLIPDEDIDKSYEVENQYIDKLITKANLSLERAENKPNVSALEILDLKKKLIILNNIKDKLSS